MPTNHNPVTNAIADAAERLGARGTFSAPDVARAAIEALTRNSNWTVIRDALILNCVTQAAQRHITRRIRRTDPRQGWLALPEYERIPQLLEIEGEFLDVNEATLEQYRESAEQLAARIRSYKFPRRAEKKLKRDKETLKQMRTLDRQVAPLMAGDPQMRLRDGIAAFERLGGRTVESRKTRASKGGKAKNRATKNQ